MPSAARRPYSKPALTSEDLLRHLEHRGLAIVDRGSALEALERIGYYRLLVYMRPLQREDAVAGARRFVVGATFGDVLALYDFDRKLRLLCMDAVERIEVSLRSAIVCEVAVRHGPHFYLEDAHFERPTGCTSLRSAVEKEARRHAASRHYGERYCEPPLPPVWVAMEAVSFGTLSHLFSNLRLDHRKAIARRFGFDETVLASWFRAVTGLRNVAAHHGRLWNAALTADKPLVAKKLKADFGAMQDSFFARALVTAALLAPDDSAEWKRRLRALLDASPHVDEGRMGFPSGWRTRPFWT